MFAEELNHNNTGSEDGNSESGPVSLDTETHKEEVALVSSNDKDISHEWCIDSGASKHMTNNEQILESLTYFEEPHRVYVGNKNFVLAHGKGSLRLRAIHPANTCFSLKEVPI